MFGETNTDRHLIAKASSAESKGVFLKMKGDYYQYLAEGDIGDAKAEVMDDSQKAYQDAFDISKSTMQPTHPNRPGRGLNLCLHVKGRPQAATTGVQRHDQDRAGESHQAQEHGAGPPLHGQAPGGEGHARHPSDLPRRA